MAYPETEAPDSAVNRLGCVGAPAKLPKIPFSVGAASI